MKNKFKLFGIAALIALIGLTTTACDMGNGNDLPPGGSGRETLRLYLAHVDTNWEPTTIDTGRTVLFQRVEAGTPDTIFYTEDIGTSATNRVVFSEAESTVTFFFRRGQNFPSTMVMAEGSQVSYIAHLSPYDSDSETFSVAFMRGQEHEIIYDIPLPMDFLVYDYNFELTPSLNLRLHNTLVALNVYNSLFIYLEAFSQGRFAGTQEAVPRALFSAGISLLIAGTNLILDGLSLPQNAPSNPPPRPNSMFSFRQVSGGYEVTRFIGEDRAVQIPATHNNRLVVSIGAFAFRSSELTGVNIPPSVTSIGMDAFANNQLVGVTIPDICTFTQNT